LSVVARNGAATRLSPGAVAFGVATAVVTLLFGGAMGAMSGMMGGGGLGLGIAGLVWARLGFPLWRRRGRHHGLDLQCNGQTSRVATRVSNVYTRGASLAAQPGR
jgi:hypothetical protein